MNRKRIYLISLAALTCAVIPAAQARPGDLDQTYGSGGVATQMFGAYSTFGGAALQSDNKLVVVGTAQYQDFGNGNTRNDPFVARFNVDGSLDQTFGSGGFVITRFPVANQPSDVYESGFFGAVAIQPDGKIVAGGHVDVSWVGGSYSDPVLARYNSDGSLDSSFGTSGRVFTNTNTGLFQGNVNGGGNVYDLKIAPDGSLYAIGGDVTRNEPNNVTEKPALLVKYSSAGVGLGMVFPNYTPTDKGKHATASALQPDGKLIINITGGDYGGASVIVDFVLMRFNPDLTADTSFGSNGVVATDFGTGTEQANGIVLDPDGKFTASGNSASSDNTGDCFAARYTTNGALDDSFGSGGKVIIKPSQAPFANIEGGSIARQPDGKYVIGLSARYGALGAIRLMPDGALDSTFGNQGVRNYQVSDPNPSYPIIYGYGGLVLLQTDGEILLPATKSNNVGTENGVEVLRLINNGELLNISTRMEVLTGNNVLIGGFIVTGSDNTKVAIRALGPSLPVSGALADPMLELHDGNGNVITTNDNWKINDGTAQSQEADVRATGIPPASDAESFILATLAGGNSAYTAIVSGKANTTGIGQVEVYDLAQDVNAQLANISTRGYVDTNDNVMIGGFISNGVGSSRIIFRGIGPSLGIDGALQDPLLEIHSKDGTVLASNDNWQDDVNASQVQAAGIAPNDPRESALYMVLPAGSYTVVLRGKTNTTGIGLVELYNLQ